MKARRGLFAAERALLIALLFIGAALFAFFKLASEVLEGETLSFDRPVLLAFRSASDPAVPIGPQWLVEAMTDLTAFGSVTGLVLVSSAVLFYLSFSGRARTALFILAATGGGAILGKLLKLAYDRPRPTVVPHLVEVATASFPSGHATDSAIVYLTLGALLARTVPEPAVRLYIICAAILLTLLIGVSRVYLGVHWPSDVAAGWAIGSAWALACSLVYAKWLTIPAETS